MGKEGLSARTPLKDLLFFQREASEQLDPNLPTVVIYSGQARKIDDLKQQGARLIEHPAGKQVFEKADEILNGHFPNRFGEGISRIVLDGSESDFRDNLQLIILLNDLACTRVFEQENGFKPVSPDNIIGTAGQSLGIASAIRFAGAIDDETLFLIGVGRHDAMRGATGTLVGFTAGDSDERITRLKKDYNLETSIKTSSGFVVLGGERDALEEAIREAESGKIRAFPLETEGAFHTSKMEPSVKLFKAIIKKMRMKDAEMDVFANTSGKAMRSTSDIKRELVDQLTHTVVWEESIERMAQRAEQFVEIGSAGTLTGHIERDMAKKRPEGKGGIIRRVLQSKKMALSSLGVALIVPHTTS